MSWPKDPFIVDSAYTTPLPCQPCERELWRLVARLYEFDTLAKLSVNEATAAKAAGGEAPSSSSSSPSMSASHITATPEHTRPHSITTPIANPGVSGSSSTRAEVVGRRNAFLAAAVAAASGTSSCSVSPPLAQGTGVGSTITTTGSRSFATIPLSTAVPAGASLSQPVSPFAVRGPASSTGSWSDNGSLSGTTSYIRAACQRVLEPLQRQLTDFAEQRMVLGAGVVDVAVQHPLPCLRLELVRLLLTYPFWDWAMCAPVAVAAGMGDVELLQLLLEVKSLDPNTGFPLTVAVRCHQEEAVLPFLLSHHRIRPNYGGAFYVAVVTGNIRAMHTLGETAEVNVNRFANNESSSALLYALRQYLICRRWEQQQEQVDPPSSTPLLHAAKPHQDVTSPTLLRPDEMKAAEKEISATPLLATHLDRSAREGLAARSPPFAASPAAQQGGQLDNPLLSGRSSEVALEGRGQRSSHGACEVAASPREAETTAAVFDLPTDDAHNGAFRRDTKARPLLSARHWREVLLYLLDHPAIEVNAGFYMTPLQICVMAGSAEVVSWLLQHPHLRPNRLPKATTTLCNSYYLLQHHALSPSALECIVATPIEMAARLNHFDIFRHLARDRRVQVPVRLTKNLECGAADGAAIPFLTVLAQYREEWEGWGWRWRRRCSLAASVALTLFAACFWLMVFLWPTTLQRCLLVFTATYIAAAVLSVALYLWEVHGLRYAASPVSRGEGGGGGGGAADTSLTDGAAALLALVRHLCPGWSALQQQLAVAMLVACPGMVPLLDLLCAWCLYRVYRSRRRLQSAPSDASAHAATLTTASPTSPSRRRRRHGQQQRAGERPCELERGSSTVSWGWSVGVSEFTPSSSFSHISTVAGSAGDAGSSHPLHSVASAVHNNNNSSCCSRTGGNVQPAEFHSTSTTISPSATVPGRMSSMASPSLSTNRNRGPWVVPGRPSRYLFTTEYHAPDLLLRALAYSAFDRVLALPRLLTCAVGIIMFMYMVFPTAAPSPSSSSAVSSSPAAVAEAIRDHSSFTLYYGVQLAATTLALPAMYNTSGAPVMTAAAASQDLPAYTIGIGVVGLCGLLSSVIGGGALLGMIGSLRTVTVQAFFSSPGDRAGASREDSKVQVERLPAGNTD